MTGDWPITGHFRESAFLLAVLKMQMHLHVSSDAESLIQWLKVLQKILQFVINFQFILCLQQRVEQKCDDILAPREALDSCCMY